MDSADAGALPLREPRRGPVRPAVATMRPKQWIKNALVVAAAGAAGALGHDDVPARVALATAAFCLLASGSTPSTMSLTLPRTGAIRSNATVRWRRARSIRLSLRGWGCG